VICLVLQFAKSAIQHAQEFVLVFFGTVKDESLPGVGRLGESFRVLYGRATHALTGVCTVDEVRHIFRELEI
jgi:hypothetical protein